MGALNENKLETINVAEDSTDQIDNSRTNAIKLDCGRKIGIAEYGDKNSKPI